MIWNISDVFLLCVKMDGWMDIFRVVLQIRTNSSLDHVGLWMVFHQTLVACINQVFVSCFMGLNVIKYRK